MGAVSDLLRMPGLVDLQVNGYAGVDFNGPELGAEGLDRASEALRRDGIVAFLPTLVTAPADFLLRRIALLSGSSNGTLRGTGSFGRMSLGIHLEGPFISPFDGLRGAYDAHCVIDPALGLMEELYAASGGSLKILTLAPERMGGIGLVEWCVAHGVKAAIGHTCADSATIARAVAAGASLSTHLGNGCHLNLPRHPNYIWDQLAEDRLTASIIADGHHLPPAFMRVAWKVKGDRLVLISDATRFTGMPPGVYQSNIGGTVRLEEGGRLSVADKPSTLAGAATPLLKGVQRIVDEGIANLDEAWRAASTVPARFLGIEESPGNVMYDAKTGIVEETVLA
jgi:N-acetylglucosamine-6-phosphate deacetylase